MRKLFQLALMVTLTVGTTMMASCSKDNSDEPEQKMVNGTDVNPRNVFPLGLPKKLSEKVLTLNEKGQLIQLAEPNDDERITFEYKDVALGSTQAPQVILTETDEPDKHVYELYLNRNGFVTHAKETHYRNDHIAGKATWDFAYNADNQLKDAKCSADKKHIVLEYQNGNVVKTTTTAAGKPTEVTTITYATASTRPIENKTGVMLFATTLDADLDYLEAAYYAGLLGKPSKNLPLQSEKSGDKANLKWTLDSNGNPTALNQSFSNSSENFRISFTW
jgi:putative lipoprotein